MNQTIKTTKELLAKKLPERESAGKTYLPETGKEEAVYCSFCRAIVTKAVKEYRDWNGKEYDDPRDVCSGGCNTNWKEVVARHLKQKKENEYHKQQIASRNALAEVILKGK